MKIYTKKGDSGQTSLIGGTRVEKYHERVEAYGTLDELNAAIGMLGDQEGLPAAADGVLEQVQDRLFVMGSLVSTDPEKGGISQMPTLSTEDISLLEEQIDQMETGLTPLKNFVLPGGHSTVSWTHIARTVCRRAERRVGKLEDSGEQADLALAYLNRLSDYLFVLGRAVSAHLGLAEKYWKPRS